MQRRISIPLVSNNSFLASKDLSVYFGSNPPAPVPDMDLKLAILKIQEENISTIINTQRDAQEEASNDGVRP